MKIKAAPIFEAVTQLQQALADSGATDIVLTNGCFDPLHVRHVRYLRGAKRTGSFLVVAVNDDKSTHTLIGDGHPVLPEGDRARLLSGLAMVDAVLIVSSPEGLVEKLGSGLTDKRIELVAREGM